MFDRKRKIGQYKFLYGKSPVLNSAFPKQGFHTPKANAGKKLPPLFNKIKNLSILIIVLVAIIFFIYAIFFSKYFTITNIALKNPEIQNQNVADQIKNSISKTLGQNILFAKTKELETKVLSVFPELEKVTITKSFPHELLIEFAEYPLVANVINQSKTIKKTYIVNGVGYAVKEDYEDKTLPYIRIQTDEPLNTKNIIIEPSKLTYILDAKKYFEDKFGMKILEIVYKPVAREIHLYTEKKFSIWLDIQRPFDQQLKKLKKALVKLNIYQDSFEYIDLRIAGNNGDKIIYKRRTT
jgi:cell division septal protein FtsQ